jgi:hypothetical protein
MKEIIVKIPNLCIQRHIAGDISVCVSESCSWSGMSLTGMESKPKPLTGPTQSNQLLGGMCGFRHQVDLAAFKGDSLKLTIMVLMS